MTSANIKAKRPRSRYVNAGIPAEIMDLIDQVIETGRYGFISRNQFVNESVKKSLQELGFYPPAYFPPAPPRETKPAKKERR